MDRNKLRELIKKYKLQILCVVTGFILFGIVTIIATSKKNEEVSVLNRKGYGAPAQSEVIVSGLSDEDMTLEISVGARRYSDEEIDDAFRRCMDEVTEIMRGENESLTEVYTDLTLPEKMNAYGFRLLWTSDDPEIISSSGEVKNSDFTDEQKNGVDVNLRVRITDGEREALYTVPVHIMPEKLTEKEGLIKRFLSSVKTADEAASSEAQVKLPESFEGKTIKYKSTEKPNYHFIWILGIVIAVLLYVREKSAMKEKQDARTKQMQLDYPEIVSKLLVFIGAGLNARMAWDYVSRDYEDWEAESEDEDSRRYAYEEMCKANTRLKTGAPEGKVYRDFGRACKTRQYMKLASLLEQNRRSGVANLKDILQLEMVEAWEERKNVARRAGEEASTKLLLPLVMMLGVVMVIIMVPAMMSF